MAPVPTPLQNYIHELKDLGWRHRGQGLGQVQGLGFSRLLSVTHWCETVEQDPDSAWLGSGLQGQRGCRSVQWFSEPEDSGEDADPLGWSESGGSGLHWATEVAWMGGLGLKGSADLLINQITCWSTEKILSLLFSNNQWKWASDQSIYETDWRVCVRVCVCVCVCGCITLRTTIRGSDRTALTSWEPTDVILSWWESEIIN